MEIKKSQQANEFFLLIGIGMLGIITIFMVIYFVCTFCKKTPEIGHQQKNKDTRLEMGPIEESIHMVQPGVFESPNHSGQKIFDAANEQSKKDNGQQSMKNWIDVENIDFASGD